MPYGWRISAGSAQLSGGIALRRRLSFAAGVARSAKKRRQNKTGDMVSSAGIAQASVAARVMAYGAHRATSAWQRALQRAAAPPARAAAPLPASVALQRIAGAPLARSIARVWRQRGVTSLASATVSLTVAAAIPACRASSRVAAGSSFSASLARKTPAAKQRRTRHHGCNASGSGNVASAAASGESGETGGEISIEQRACSGVKASAAGKQYRRQPNGGADGGKSAKSCGEGI